MESSLRIAPCGKLESLMRQQEAPELKRTWNYSLEHIVPTVPMVQMVAGISEARIPREVVVSVLDNK